MAVKLKWRKSSGPSSRWQAHMAGLFPRCVVMVWCAACVWGSGSGPRWGLLWCLCLLCVPLCSPSVWLAGAACHLSPTYSPPLASGLPRASRRTMQGSLLGPGSGLCFVWPGRLSPLQPSPDGPMAEAPAKDVGEGFCGGQRAKMATPGLGFLSKMVLSLCGLEARVRLDLWEVYTKLILSFVNYSPSSSLLDINPHNVFR